MQVARRLLFTPATAQVPLAALAVATYALALSPAGLLLIPGALGP